MEELVDYLANGQPTMTYPDREAKFVRNHPFMTQLDFFDMQDEQKRAWEEQSRDKEAEQVAKDRKQSKAIVLARGRDQGAQVKTVTDKEWDDFARIANRAWDAETDTMDTQDANKKELAANTMRYALVQQTWFPSWGMPALGWYRNTPDPMIPSAPTLAEIQREEEPEPVRRRGSKGKQKVPPIKQMTGTTADGIAFPIYYLVGEKAKDFAKGAARFGASATMAVAKGALDFADNYTFDIQGKRAERYAEFEEGNAKGRALNNPLAIMDWAGEEARATMKRHTDYYAIGSRPEYEPREHREGKPIDWANTAIVRSAKHVKGGIEQAYTTLGYPYA
jgi:hypothetical protein